MEGEKYYEKDIQEILMYIFIIDEIKNWFNLKGKTCYIIPTYVYINIPKFLQINF